MQSFFATRKRALALAGAASSTAFALYYAQLPSDKLSPHRFINAKISQIHSATPSTKILTLDIPAVDTAQNKSPLIQSILIAQPELSITRNYTPLDILSSSCRIAVKAYHDGETSKYIHRRQIGQPLRVSGPFTSWQAPSDVQQIVFIAAGTGVTPFVQLAQQYNRLPIDTRPKLHLIYAPSRDGPLLLDELHALAQDNHNITMSLLQPTQRLDYKYLNSRNISCKPDRGSYALVCGPDCFIRDIAGPKAADTVSDGPLGGALKKLGWSETNVKKL